VLALGGVGLDVPRLQQELEKVEPAELIESDHGLLDRLALPVDAGLEAPDVLLNGGKLRPAPLELDVLGGQLPRDEAPAEVDPGERREDGRFLAGLGLEPRLEVLDLPVDAVQALLEVGDVLVLGGGRGGGRRSPLRLGPGAGRGENEDDPEGEAARENASHPLFYNIKFPGMIKSWR